MSPPPKELTDAAREREQEENLNEENEQVVLGDVWSLGHRVPQVAQSRPAMGSRVSTSCRICGCMGGHKAQSPDERQGVRCTADAAGIRPHGLD